MSLYQVQKLFFHVNSDAERRARYLADPRAFIAGYDLDAAERAAILAIDIAALYKMGVDPLLLRPFTIIHKIAAKDHYAALRGGAS